MDYVLGIDGGGTSTICLLADAEGRVVARAEAPASNHRKADLREARQSIAAGVRAVLEKVGTSCAGGDLPRVAAACAGLAGVDTHDDAETLRQMLAEIVSTEHLRVVNDGEIALYGALEDAPGVLVISGTGSIVWAASADGRRVRVGGWDYVLSDEGSGYQIGLRALRAVAAAHDGRTPPTSLTASVLRSFAAESFDQLLGVIYHEEMTPQRIASLAPLADAAAASGDVVASRVFEEAAGELVHLAASAVCLAELSQTRFPVVPMGGVLLAGGQFAGRFRALLGAAVPGAYCA
ncbi:MAG: BadF/BadG/BcrA/BcrD ATPase family protein, partial [Pyrinomonadaceae bacterium]